MTAYVEVVRPICEYHVRDLLTLTKDEVWNLPDGPIALTFDDGEVVQTTQREMLFSSYIWMIHRMYPKTPLLSRHLIGKQRLSAKTHLDLLSHAIWDCYDAYAQYGIDIEVLSKHAYDITNEIYNDFTLRLEEWVASLSALDFIEVLDHPTIFDARQKMFESNGVGEYNPDNTNAIIQKALMNEPGLNRNAIAKIARSNLVKSGQIIQCVGSRGRPTDIDSHIFRKWILDGFATGLTELVDMMMESRSASMSLYFQKDPMKKSEYFNRSAQLSSAALMTLYKVDCGSKNYLPITVNSGTMLKDMNGIAYLDEATQTERVIRGTSKHLIGKMVMIRSPFTCQHPDRYGVCVRCFGEIGLSIPHGTNLGHVCSSETQSKVGQLLLSNKHYVSSASADRILLDEFDRQFVITGTKDDSHLYVNPSLKGKPYFIAIDEEEAKNLSDIVNVSNTNQLIPYRLSEINYMEFIMAQGESRKPYTVRVSSGIRTASLSREMLAYVKTKHWTYDEHGRYVIDMCDWDVTKPFVELPLKNFSTLDYMLSLESFIKGGATKGRKSIMGYETHSAMVMAFHDLVSLKLDVPLSYLQAILLAAMVQSRPNRDYRLPLPREEGKPALYKQLMDLRSLSAAMAYQGQTATIFGVSSYLITDRPPHPLDYLLVR